MKSHLVCFHGHELGVGDDIPDKQELVCPLCGSLRAFRKNTTTDRPEAYALTVVPVSAADASLTGRYAGLTAGGDSSALETNAPNSESTQETSPEQLPVDANPDAAEVDVADGRDQDVPVEEAVQYARPTKRKRKKKLTPPELPGYEVMEELGRGGMGVVYHAYDEKRGRDVALKTLQRMSPDDIVRFKQEFRALSDIAHTNLASLYELLSDGKTWCFTMEILEGVEFLDYVWSEFDSMKLESGRSPVAEIPGDSRRLSMRRMNRLYEAMQQLSVGLNQLHQVGKLHSDIKPSNVLVTKENRVVLLDFGLIAEINKDKDGRVSRMIQGTPQYMSPEQAACAQLSGASDMYAVGVMLYEVLTGRLPIHDKSVRIMLRKQYDVPRAPIERQPGTPPELNELCMALLEIDSRNRPSITDLLRAFDAEELARGIEESQPVTAVRSVDLVGREKHFEVLSQAWTDVVQGHTHSVFVHGLSGMGKSVLIRTFIDGIRNGNEAVVLEGRCYEQESVPFKALDNLIDSLVSYVATLPASDLDELIPDDMLPLIKLFPVLGQIPGATERSQQLIENADQQELRQRALSTLRELLVRLGRRQPIVLYIDDMQWGDEDSANLIADLLRPPDSPRILLLGSYRREDIDSSPSLLALADAYSRGQHRPQRCELPVEPLSTQDATRLAMMLLNRSDSVTRRFADRIANESGGSPFFVWELAQHVQDDTTSAVGTLELDEVIWSRVCRLPVETRRLLEVFAVSGRPMRASEAYLAIDEVTHGPSLLAQLRTNNFIRTTEHEDDTVVETYHDRIRESVVNHLANAKVRGHHLKLALVIEQASNISVANVQAHIDNTPDFAETGDPFELDKRQWQRVSDLSFFFDAAEKPERAMPYALTAAERAWSQNAFDVAEQQFEIARRGADSARDAIRFRIAEGLGDVLMMRGRYDQANQQFQTARSLAIDNVTAARIEGKLGALAFKRGDLGPAGDYLEKALIALNERPPGSFPSLMMRFFKEATVQVMHTFFPALVGRKNANTTEGRMDLFRSRLFEDFTRICWYSRGVEMCLWSHLRQMNITERYPPSAELAKVYSFHSIVMSGLPLPHRGRRYAQRSHDISLDRGDLWGQGQALSFYTFNYFVQGQHEKAIEVSSRGVELLEQAGDVWEANMARMMNTWALYHAGDLKAAFRQNKRVYAIGKEVGDYSAMAISLCFWMQIDPASAPEGAMQTEADRPREDVTSGALAIQGRGLEILFREDDPLQAAEVLQNSLDLCKRKGVRNVCVFAGATWKVTALRIAAEREPAGASRQQAIKQAQKAARAALGITKRYRTCRAHLLRECGILETLAGRDETARRYFDDSIVLAEQQGARREHAKSELARCEAGLQFGLSDAEQQIAGAKLIVDEIENLEGVE